MRRRKRRPRPCLVQPVWDRESDCSRAIIDQQVDLPFGTRGQATQCRRCLRWHVEVIALTDVGRRAELSRLHAMCLRKVRYPTEGSALVAALRRPVWLRPYECPYCAGWHLTKHGAFYGHAA